MTDGNHTDNKRSPEIFRFHRPLIFSLWMGVMSFGQLAFSYRGLVEKNNLEFVFFFMGSIFFFVLWIISILCTSEITIDEVGISRKIFNKVWQAIQWGNIRQIKIVVTAASKGPKSLKAFSIYPIKKPKFNFFISNKMSFFERFDWPPTFAMNMNSYIKKFDVEVIFIAEGVRAKQRHI